MDDDMGLLTAELIKTWCTQKSLCHFVTRFCMFYTRPIHQVRVYRTIGPLALLLFAYYQR